MYFKTTLVALLGSALLASAGVAAPKPELSAMDGQAPSSEFATETALDKMVPCFDFLDCMLMGYGLNASCDHTGNNAVLAGILGTCVDPQAVKPAAGKTTGKTAS